MADGPVDCKKKMRDPKTGITKTCIGFIPKGKSECINHKAHLHQYVSGWCGGHNQCEGMKPRSPSGRPMKTCHMWLTCPCDCHEEISQMFAMSKRERQVVDNPEYIVDHSAFIMPTAAEVEQARALKSSSTPVTIVKSEDPRIPDTVVKEFHSKSGRAQKGELELYVKQCCDAYRIAPNRREITCGVKYVAQWIFDQKLMAVPPSPGAVDAVFKRWTAINFALIGTKPTRFLMYTPEGIEHGLEGMKAQAKRGSRTPTTLRSSK